MLRSLVGSEMCIRDSRNTYLDNIVNDELKNGLDVELVGPAPYPTVEGTYFIKSRYHTKARGPWQDVKEFIYRLQKPTEFRFVPKLNLVPRKSEADDSKQYVE